MGTDVLTRPDTEENVENEEGEKRHAHIVYPSSKVTEAYINGTPVTALCGHTWVPSRDPENFPLCSKCKEIFDKIRKKDD